MAAKESFIEKYKNGNYNNPQKDKKTTNEYILEKCQYIFSNYVKGLDATNWTSREDFETLRSYGAGKQQEEIYMPYFYGNAPKKLGETFDINGVDIGGTTNKFDSQEWARKALGHMNWKIMSPMPKIKNKILSSLNANQYDIEIECVDENSIAKQDEKKWRTWVESQAESIAFMKQLQSMTGMPYTPPNKKIETIEELELEEANGGFKLNYAKEGEKIIKDAWNISNEEEICEKVIDDLVDLNIAGYRVYYDRENGKEMFRWLDPANSGIQHSKHNDFRDSAYGYEVIFEPAFKLQSYGLDPKELPSVASRYAGMFGNPDWSSTYKAHGGAEPEDSCGFFKVPVLDIEFISVDVEKSVKYTTRLGKEQIRPYEEGEKLSANKQYMETKIHKVYQAKWVIDTDILYDAGLKPNQPRRNKNQAVLSFHFIKGKTAKSITEQLIPVLDDFQMTWLKFQDAKASAVKSGLAIEWGSLMGMKIGGNELTPFDLLRIYRTTGDIFYRRNQRHNGVSQAMPITPMQNNTTNLLNDLVNALDVNAKLIEEITGINPVSLGATADPSAGKAVTELSVSASAAPIKNVFDKVFQLKAHASLDLLQRVQLDMRNSKTVAARYKSVIGEFGVQTLIEAEGMGVRFGTQLIARPNQQKIAQIEQYVAIALQSGKNGIPLLSIPEALYITRRLEEGAKWKEIEAYITFKEKQKTAEQQAYAQQSAQANAEYQQQLQQMKQQQDVQNAQLEVEKEGAKINSKKNADIELENVKSKNKLEEIKVEGQSGARVR